jgi:hypothetical protein
LINIRRGFDEVEWPLPLPLPFAGTETRLLREDESFVFMCCSFIGDKEQCARVENIFDLKIRRTSR